MVVFQDTSADAAEKLPGGSGKLQVVLDRRGELVRRFKVTRAPAVLLVEAERRGPGALRSRTGRGARAAAGDGEPVRLGDRCLAALALGTLLLCRWSASAGGPCPPPRAPSLR